MAKGFTLGAQYEALFTDDLFFENGRAANRAASYLVRELTWFSVEFIYPPESNQLFIRLPKAVADELEKHGQFDIMGPKEDGTVPVRFVTDYNTTKDEIDGAIKILEDLLNETL